MDKGANFYNEDNSKKISYLKGDLLKNNPNEKNTTRKSELEG